MNRFISGWFPTDTCSESVRITTFEIANFAVLIAEYPMLFSKSSAKNAKTLFTLVQKILIFLLLQKFFPLSQVTPVLFCCVRSLWCEQNVGKVIRKVSATNRSPDNRHINKSSLSQNLWIWFVPGSWSNFLRLWTYTGFETFSSVLRCTVELANFALLIYPLPCLLPFSAELLVLH